MNRDEINVKSSEVAEVPKVQDERTSFFATPYYWSWYRSIFARHDGGDGFGRFPGTEENR
ncbi:MAG TPA: hypothetical protein VFG19_01830 [Geobacteraceae bacterium]|nr:hypothetical protein [Geobacteraceae bacterium]